MKHSTMRSKIENYILDLIICIILALTLGFVIMFILPFVYEPTGYWWSVLFMFISVVASRIATYIENWIKIKK